MSRTHSWTLWPALAVFLVPACGDSEPDAIEAFIAGREPLNVRAHEIVREAAHASEPSWILTMSLAPAEYARYVASEMGNGCPRYVDRSNAGDDLADWRLEGDCTDPTTGTRFEGSIVVRGNPEGTEIQYRDFRMTGPNDAWDGSCAGYEKGYAFTGVSRLPFPWIPASGEAEEPMEPDPDPSGHYDVHVYYVIQGVTQDDAGACQSTLSEMAYDVTMDVTREGVDPDEGLDGDERFDVDGRVATRASIRTTPDEPWRVTEPLGGAWTVSARDYGERHDHSAECHHFLAGTLSLAAGEDVATLAPDATASCLDEDSGVCAPWSVNGAEQPERMCGFSPSGCSAGPDASPPWLALFIALAGLLWLGYRRPRRAVASALVLAALALPDLAHAQAPDLSPVPAASASNPVEHAKSPVGATMLAVASTTTGYFLMLRLNDDSYVVPTVGLALFLAGPSFGHFYAGEVRRGLLHSGLRAGALAMMVGGVVWAFHDCDFLFGGCDENPAAMALFFTGLVGGTTSALYSLVDAHHAAERHNAKLRQLMITPAPLAGPDHATGFGLHLRGRF
jgi:MYXO-CTERM domain-containing protein